MAVTVEAAARCTCFSADNGQGVAADSLIAAAQTLSASGTSPQADGESMELRALANVAPIGGNPARKRSRVSLANVSLPSLNEHEEQMDGGAAPDGENEHSAGNGMNKARSENWGTSLRQRAAMQPVVMHSSHSAPLSTSSSTADKDDAAHDGSGSPKSVSASAGVDAVATAPAVDCGGDDTRGWANGHIGCSEDIVDGDDGDAHSDAADDAPALLRRRATAAAARKTRSLSYFGAVVVEEDPTAVVMEMEGHGANGIPIAGTAAGVESSSVRSATVPILTLEQSASAVSV
eukprot:Opistho-2@177